MTKRREFSKPVKREAFARAGGRCEATFSEDAIYMRCATPLTIGKYHYDHIIPDGQGGEPTLENCAVICHPCHKLKTRGDIKAIAKTKRIQDRHHGITTPRQKIQSRGFGRTEPQRTASRPIRAKGGI